MSDLRDDAAAPAPGKAGQPVPPTLGPVRVSVRHGLARLRLRQWAALVGALMGFLLVVPVAMTGSALYETEQARMRLADVIDPVSVQTLRLENAVAGQDADISRYALTADPRYLTEYHGAVTDEAQALRELRTLHARYGPVVDERRLTLVATDMAAWRRDYAEPLAAAVRAHGPAAKPGNGSVRGADQTLTAVRTALEAQQRELAAQSAQARRHLRTEVRVFYGVLALAIAMLVASIAVLFVLLRRTVVEPVSGLTEQVRRVARGDFAHPLKAAGPAELAELATHVDSMRRRIVQEWKTAADARELLDEQAAELRRSNAELEQFAYVASHDLQEPLRKVASFCQMLERRYADVLDERGRQYIAFAVDGAKRMQTLINDLLSFSRVGRRAIAPDAVVNCEDALRAALHNLAGACEESRAEVTWDPLPDVPGDATLLTQLFQNLIGNAIKFRGEEPPRVHIGVRRTNGEWEFSCADNGIGVEPRYAERIFLIFQRLHPPDEYSGTGIGLALCKKIVEYHGGRIWLDTDRDPQARGTTIRWTLPAAPPPAPERTPPTTGDPHD